MFCVLFVPGTFVPTPAPASSLVYVSRAESTPSAILDDAKVLFLRLSVQIGTPAIIGKFLLFPMSSCT